MRQNSPQSIKNFRGGGMPPHPPTEAVTRLLPPSAAWLLEPPPIQNPGYATAHTDTRTDYCKCVHS